MQCVDKTEAKRVAYFGARKMVASGGYTYRAMSPGLPLKDRRIYQVFGPEGQVYRVSVACGACSCPFNTENRPLFRDPETGRTPADGDVGACKHVYWLRWQLDEEALWDERLKDAQ